MPIRRSLIGFAILIFGLPIGYFAFLANAPQATPVPGGGPRAEVEYEYHVVGNGDVIAVVSAVGAIEPDETVDAALTTGGRVAEIFVEPMTYVEAGDLLLQLDNENQRIAYDQAVLNLELAEIDQDDLLGPIDGDDVRLAQAQVDAAYGAWRGSLYTASPAQIAAAELQVQQAEAAIQAAQERRIFGGDFANEEEVALADAAIGEASFNAEIARLQLEDLRSGNYASANAAFLRYEQALAQLEQVLAGPTELQLEQAAVNVELAEAQLVRAETALEKTQLRAPVTGFVTLVNIEVGELAIPGQPLIRMVDVDPLSVSVQIDEIDIGRVQPGTRARVEVDALPNVVLDAQLEKVALTGTQTQGGIVNYDAEIRLETVDPRVRVGMTAEANLIVEEREGVVRVPNAYIRLNRRTNSAQVNLVGENNEIIETEVVIGLQGEDFSEIVSGLSPGDIIAADLSGTQLSFGG